MSDMPSIRLYGSNVTEATVSEAGGHFVDLLNELGREKGATADLFSLGTPRCICDQCETERPSEHPGWVNTGFYDFCGPCAADLASRAAL